MHIVELLSLLDSQRGARRTRPPARDPYDDPPQRTKTLLLLRNLGEVGSGSERTRMVMMMETLLTMVLKGKRSGKHRLRKAEESQPVLLRIPGRFPLPFSPR